MISVLFALSLTPPSLLLLSFFELDLKKKKNIMLFFLVKFCFQTIADIQCFVFPVNGQSFNTCNILCFPNVRTVLWCRYLLNSEKSQFSILYRTWLWLWVVPRCLSLTITIFSCCAQNRKYLVWNPWQALKAYFFLYIFLLLCDYVSTFFCSFCPCGFILNHLGASLYITLHYQSIFSYYGCYGVTPINWSYNPAHKKMLYHFLDS